MTRRCGDVWLCLMPALDRSHAIDNIVVVLFENRSLDNVLGRLYGPEDGKNFDGVIGKDLSNPIPEKALGNGLSGLGKSMGHGLIEHARELGLELPSGLDDPAAEPTPADIIEVFRQVAGHYFPLLAPDKTAAGHPAGT